MAGVLMTLQGYQIYVYGYTDNIGTQEYNQKLSERRAVAVRDYLVQSGVDPKGVATKDTASPIRSKAELPGACQEPPRGNQHCRFRAAHGRRSLSYNCRQPPVKN